MVLAAASLENVQLAARFGLLMLGAGGLGLLTGTTLSRGGDCPAWGKAWGVL